MARRVTANSNPKNSVMTDLNIVQAVEVVRANPSTTFAADLVAAYDKYRNELHGSKAAWIIVIAQQIIDRRNKPAPATQTTTLTSDFAGLTAIFRTAQQNKKKYPKIALRTAGGLPIVLSLAGEKSRYAGSVNVTDGGKYGDNVYYGRIEPNGAFSGREPSEDVLSLLRRFAADPAGVAAAYGRETGECCFCQAELTDERSVMVGYGPICADKHGLPWGDRPAKSALVQSGLPLRGDEDVAQVLEDERLVDERLVEAYAEDERQRELVGFASDPDFRRFSPMTYDELVGRAAVVAIRDGHLVSSGAVSAPWRDDD